MTPNKRRIAVLIGANIYNQKGLFNAAHERVKHLIDVSDFQVDLFLISTYKSGIGRLLSLQNNYERPETFKKDGLIYRILWIKRTILDYILIHKLKKSSYNAKREYKKHLNKFKDYELIVSHTAGSYVLLIHQTYGIPYIITWHGSDIHTNPFLSNYYFKVTKQLLENAAHNFFVSEALLNTSDLITKKASKSVSYNGCSKKFICYPLEEKLRLKEKFSVNGKKIVAFVGNLISVKNIKSLPEIFYYIYKEEQNVEFWILGNGPMMKFLKANTTDFPIRFWGDIDHSQMVDYMNMMDVLILPSFNEGLPLVTIEALNCGCSVVGSRIGGIPESIGEENTVPLDDICFSQKIANRALELIKSCNSIVVDNCFNWQKIAQQESKIIHSILRERRIY